MTNKDKKEIENIEEKISENIEVNSEENSKVVEDIETNSDENINDVEVISDIDIEDNTVDVEENIQVNYLDAKVLEETSLLSTPPKVTSAFENPSLPFGIISQQLIFSAIILNFLLLKSASQPLILFLPRI